MTSQIGSSIEYLIPNDDIMVLLLHSSLRENLSTDFQYDLIKIGSGLLLGHTLQGARGG